MEREYWAGRWREGRTGWDLGGPHPLCGDLIRLMERTLTSPPTDWTVYVPGCGRAHEAAFFARTGAEVTGVDAAAEAIAAARILYGGLQGLNLFVGDAVSLEAVEPRENGLWSAIVDRAMMNALPPGMRERYLEACLARLAPGGLFASIVITATREGSVPPPFPLRESDSEDLFGAPWRRVGWIEVGDSPSLLPLQEAIALYAKR